MAPDAETPPAQPPAPAPPAPAPSSLPSTPDAAERWLADDEPEPQPVPEPQPPPEPAPPVAVEPTPAAEPRPQVYGVDSELYRRLGTEDQQAIREGYEAEEAEEAPAPAPSPTPTPPPEAPADLPSTPDAAERWLADRATEPDPAPEAAPAPAPAPPANLPSTPDAAERWLADRAAEPEPQPTSEAPEAAEPQPPEPAPPHYTPCSSLQPYNPDVCIEHPVETYGGGDPFRCVPGEGPADDSCRTLTADEFEDPPDEMIWCHPLQGPYIGTRPCAPGEEPPPEPPAFNQAPTPSDDYESWRDPSRRQAEYRERYGDALPTSREWEIPDLQEREQGRLRFGLFIGAEDAGVLGINGEGDDRGFDPQFSPANTRAYIEVDFENDHAYVVSNPTCHAGAGQCNDAKHIGDGALSDYSSEVTLENRDDGSIYIQYELSNSRLPAWLFFMQGPSIDGHITIEPNEDESFTINWFVDPYPSVEAYFDDGCGRTYTLVQNEEGSSPVELNPASTDIDFTTHMLQQGDATC